MFHTSVCCSRARRYSAAFTVASYFFLLVFLPIGCGSLLAAEAVQLARDGKPLLNIAVSEDAAAGEQRAAKTLADFLGKISGGKFEVLTGDGSQGIAVGLARRFAKCPVADKWQTVSVPQREEYLIRTHAGGVWLVGATELAVEQAVWDFFYRLGYRQFFPGEHWEVIPHEPNLSAAIDSLQSPSYHNRRIWYGYGTWPGNKADYENWCVRNRMGGGVDLKTGHSYDSVVHDARKQFDAHPEYWPLLHGQRAAVSNPKPCLGNPAVRAIFVEHALRAIEKNPAADSVSVDPSDGGGWCECEACAKLGSVSDQALTLANEVAAAISAKYPDKYVGMYAYNQHSPPPNIRVHSHVIVSVATAFIKGGLSFDEILRGWSEKGATLGVREYYSVNVWDRDQPGHARGGNLDYLRRTIPEFHAGGARFMSAESSENWGPNGLGYYLAARMMWDVGEAKNIDALVDDFLARAFGPARAPMREFYQQIDGSKPHLVVDDQLGRMFRALDQARKLADSPAIHARLDDLTLYAQYCSLYHHYAMSSDAERQAAFETLIRFAYRIRGTMMIHSLALYRDLAARDKTVKIPTEAAWNVPDGKNPWKSSEPFTAAAIADFVAQGIAAHKLVELNFKPAEFSSDYVPAAAKLHFPELLAGDVGPGRGVQTFYTYVEKAPVALQLKITGGLIPHYRDRGNVKVDVWKVGGASETGERETPAGSDRSTPPDGNEHAVTLPLKDTGLYKLTVSDGDDRTRVTWPADQPMTIVSTQQTPINKRYEQWMQYFYVPQGTRQIGLFGGEHGEVRDSHDRALFWLNGREPNFYSVDVPEGEDGKVWRVRYVRGSLHLLTVPPCFASTPQGLLLPKEVVQRDAK